MIVTAVIVTYGERFHFVEKVIFALKKESINKIILVLNGVGDNSKRQIASLDKKEPLVHVLDLKENTGSANGFSQGMLFSKKMDSNFIWLLDDDNEPQKNALKTLKIYWEILEKENIKNLMSLVSYRPDRKVYKDAIESQNPYLMIGDKNSFLGFNFKKFLKKKPLNRVEKNHGVIAVAPYGGSFFHSSLIESIGIPNKDFFLYGDDFDFFYRITKAKGNIYLIAGSKIKDLEVSFNLNKKKGKLNTRFFLTDSKERLYYNIRNNIVFEKNFVDNKCVYLFNMISYFIFAFLLFLLKPSHFWKYKLLFKSWRDSKNFQINKE